MNDTPTKIILFVPTVGLLFVSLLMLEAPGFATPRVSAEVAFYFLRIQNDYPLKNNL